MERGAVHFPTSLRIQAKSHRLSDGSLNSQADGNCSLQ